MINKSCFLRYPGGKSRALKKICDYFPSEIEEIREPFVGGGSVSLYLHKKFPNAKVWVNDLYYNLYCFWLSLRDNGEELSERLMEIKNNYFPENDKEKSKEHFFYFVEKIKNVDKNTDQLEVAILFYILNKCSFSGMTECNYAFSFEASKQAFTRKSIEELKLFSELIKDFKITNMDYSELMKEEGKGVFVFLDPPYDILKGKKQTGFLYGKGGNIHKNFDHLRFAEEFANCEHNSMITYNYSDILIDRYKKYNQVVWSMKYGMTCSNRGKDKEKFEKKLKEKNELLIMNYKK